VAGTSDQAAGAPAFKHPGSPQGKVIGSVDPSQVEAVKDALVAAGFPADTIDSVRSEDLDDLHAPIDRPGVAGLVNRFLFSLGDDLDELERSRQELRAGRTLIGVRVQGDDAVHRAADIFRDHGADWITHFGSWTIKSL
jgi:hypothetical protein